MVSLDGLIAIAIKTLLFLVLAVVIAASLIAVLSMFIFPLSYEYDDPNTAVEETFPWNPNIFTNGKKVLSLFVMGMLQHIATLPEHMRSATIISLVGYVFVTIFIYRIRRTFLDFLNGKVPQIGIHNYVEWGFGSIIGAIIFITGIVSDVADLASATSGIFWLSISALVVYIIHPHLRLLRAIKDRINPRIPCPSCNKQIPPISKFCYYCGKKLRKKDKFS